jgi:hypothetical protein
MSETWYICVKFVTEVYTENLIKYWSYWSNTRGTRAYSKLISAFIILHHLFNVFSAEIRNELLAR